MTSLFANSQPTFRVQHLVEPIPDASSTTVLKWLVETKACPTASQARRACKFGTVVAFSSMVEDQQSELATAIWSLQQLEKHQILDSSTIIQNSHDQHHHQQRLAIMTRLPDKFYPIHVTKYIAPPRTTAQISETLQVVYEDDDIAIVNKPEGLTTIDASSRDDLQSMLPFCLCPPSTSTSSVVPLVPRPVHRLDRMTSGLVLCAKSKKALQYYSQAFRERQFIQKTYTAIVMGKPSLDHGTIDYPIDGKEAVSRWKLLRTTTIVDDDDEHSLSLFSMLEIQPKTGRFHQIRRHLNYCLGCPIVGDPKYGGRRLQSKSLSSFGGQGMFLCANALEFQPMMGGETAMPDVHRIEIPLPDKFEQFMTQQQRDVLATRNGSR